MKRTEMINKIGIDYLTSNVENEEYNYPKAYKSQQLPFDSISSVSQKRNYETVDLRFEHDGITVLIETKVDYRKNIDEYKRQLAAYVEYEKKLTGNKVIAMLANTGSDNVYTWRGAISDEDFLGESFDVKSMSEYVDLYTSKVNDKEKVMQNTYHLNELLHKHGVSEKLRSQFVGTCLLALKRGLSYTEPSFKATQIIAGIKDVLSEMLTDDLNKAAKLSLLDTKVLHSQDIRALEVSDLREILAYIEYKILPFINDKSTAGQDLLNLFFVTFNKYVGKDDKNRLFVSLCG